MGVGGGYSLAMEEANTNALKLTGSYQGYLV